MPNKVKTARLCLIVAGALKFATAGLFLFILVAGSVFVGRSGERSGLLGNALLGALGVILLLASAAAGAFDLLAAVGVRRRAAWGRALGVIAGILMIPLFPVGTVLGFFALTGLLGADGREWFTAGPVNL
jgi:hypothetical protein